MKRTLTAALVALSISCFAQDAKSATTQQKTTGKSDGNKALTQEFEQAKGKLEMPVTGTITEHAGVNHKTNRYNDGISIETGADAAVHAIFEGTVCSVLTIDGSQIVMVQHGSYFTVYNNIKSTSVIRGQHVSPSQNIGIAGKRDDKGTLSFQIWKSNGPKSPEKLDPEEWLHKA